MIKVDLEEGYIGIPIKGLKEIFKDGHIEFIGGLKLISKLEEIMQEIYEKEKRSVLDERS